LEEIEIRQSAINFHNIFDEATSALDVETELSIIDTLNGLDKDLTLIIVTHRPTLTQFCNKIWVVGNSAVQENIKN
jgi:ABC-type multidrug transport system fused ATPase/permease subunit